ncbi:uncharacterized protein LOC126313334 [Schistocerca gregaria]|uniref:uncharacterized protein LOC126313334 n=1 Tax=Schistocerca gregaria TaxID=7010 RepID=UPI00211EC5BF|nr:uncharacterized protein LOC126313334 [Schistocerca gregaria]
MSARTCFVGGNWKCFGSNQSIDALVSGLLKADLSNTSAEVVVAPPFVYLSKVKEALAGKNISIAAQNCWRESEGAFTGEVSPAMLRDIGVHWVILGHSERRHIIKENDELLKKKVEAALKHGLKVIFCVGEQLEDRKSKRAQEVVTAQLDACKEHIGCWENVVIAYEPVWAIGTGEVATPQQVQEIHSMIRRWFEENISSSVAQKIRIIYGGSVKPQNSTELAKNPDVDGFLVGGASLVADQFASIIRSTS